MSKFYGTLRNERGKESTRCGHSSISTWAQSFDGTVRVSLQYQGPEGKTLMVLLSCHSGSVSNGDHRLVEVYLPFDEFVACIKSISEGGIQ